MPIDPGAAAAFLAARAADPVAGPWPEGAPAHEYTRSPAAARVGELARADGLFLFHFEHRVHPELPEEWVPPGRLDLAAAPAWEGGVLPERKYLSFRHDLPIGSFHPGHRAKWTTHELCHALVGFAWHPRATPFFLATAGRLAELVPVVLWYFLDEVHLQRCPAHQGAGALFRTLCPACEAVAGPRLDDPDALRRLEDARRFLDGELAAVARSRRSGRPVPHQWATLDLCSDGVAYAGAHAPRLQSEAFARLADEFLVDGGGLWTSLDDLEERVVAVARGLCGEAVAPLAPDAETGRWRWIVQDLAWRLLVVWSQTEGEASRGVDALLERLEGTPEAISAVVTGYGELFEEFVLPEPEEVFGVGYDLPGGEGHALTQLAEGLASGLPLTSRLLGDRMDVAGFAREDAPARRPLPERFAAASPPGPIGDLARYEATLRALPGRDATLAALGRDEGPHRLADGFVVLRAGVDVVDLAEGAELGDYAVDHAGRIVHGDGTPIEARDTALVIGRDPAGELLVLDVSPATADGLSGEVEPEEGELAALRDLGVLRPVRWRELGDPG